ncbi:hypothetical protein LB506_003999 [Fusarium annulatum]|nr:hypothetical protein LB506_003999 [Fusarium annulatum]
MLCTHYRSAPPVPVRYSEVAYSVRRGYFYPIILDPVLIPVQVQSDLVVQGCFRSAQPTGASCEAPTSIAVITSSTSTISSIVPLFPRYLALPTSPPPPKTPLNSLLSYPTSSLFSPLLLINNRHTPPSFSVSLSLSCIVFAKLDVRLQLLFGTRHPSSQVPTSRPVIPYLLQSSLAGLAPILESSYNRIPCDLLFRLNLSSQIPLLTSQ